MSFVPAQLSSRIAYRCYFLRVARRLWGGPEGRTSFGRPTRGGTLAAQLRLKSHQNHSTGAKWAKEAAFVIVVGMPSTELVKKWLGKLTQLNPASGRGHCRGKAPHKPLLLLCFVDMAETGELKGRAITRTANLVLRFKEYGSLVSPRWPTRLDLRMPFFYLRTQGFWQGLTLQMTPAVSPESCFVCELNEEFFDLLGDADSRLKARLLMVSRYFEPPERVALLESLGLCADGLQKVERRKDECAS